MTIGFLHDILERKTGKINMKNLIKICLLLILSLAFVSCELNFQTNDASHSNNQSFSNDVQTPTILRGTWTNSRKTESITITENNVIYKTYTVDDDENQTLLEVINYKEDNNYITMFGVNDDKYFMSVRGMSYGNLVDKIYTYDLYSNYLRVSYKTWSGNGGAGPYYPDSYFDN